MALGGVHFFVYVCSPRSTPWWLVKLVACLSGLPFHLTLWFFYLLSSTPPPTFLCFFFHLFIYFNFMKKFIFSKIPYSSSRYRALYLEISFFNWGGLLQVSIWLEKNCASICFQSQHLCLTSWKCSKKSFCLVILLSFMNGFLERFLILLHGEWLGLG